MPTNEEATDDGPVCRLQSAGRDVTTLSECPLVHPGVQGRHQTRETKASSCEDAVTPTVLNVILPDGGSLISCERLCFRRVDAALRTRTARSVFLVEAEAESTRRAVFL